MEKKKKNQQQQQQAMMQAEQKKEQVEINKIMVKGEIDKEAFERMKNDLT